MTKKSGQIAFVVEREMQFHCPLGAAEHGPGEGLGTQVDHRRIQAEQFVVEAEGTRAGNGTAALQQLIEHRLKQLPGTMFVGVGQGGPLRSLPHAQLLQLAFATGQAATDLAQRVRLAQLAKQHGDELRPAIEPARMPLCLGGNNGPLKIGPGKQLEKLIENAAKSSHRGWCSGYGMVSVATPPSAYPAYSTPASFA